MKRGRGDCSMKNLPQERACDECTMNCVLVHRKEKNPFASVERSFKIMVEGYSEVLFLPPKFTRDNGLSEFIGSKAWLVDSAGLKYPVGLSEVDHSVVFKEGWPEFIGEHGLEPGDFLVFQYVRYMKNLHFHVHIYGLDGCEKLSLPVGYDGRASQKKKKAPASNHASMGQAMSFATKQDPSPLVPSNSCSRNNYLPIVTTNNLQGDDIDVGITKLDHAPMDMEEQFYELNRDVGRFEDDRACLHDISIFEKQKGSVAAEVNLIDNCREATTNRGEKTIKPQKDLILLDSSPLKRKFTSPEALPYIAKTDLVEKTDESAPINVAPMDKFVKGGESSIYHAEKVMKFHNKSGSVDRIPVQRLEIKIEDITESGLVTAATDTKCGVPTAGHSNLHLLMSSENPGEKSRNKDVKIPKRKRLSSNDVSNSLAAREASLAVVEDKPFLQLESRLPSVLSRGSRAKLRPIYLRAPDERQWPVIYHEKGGVQVLTTGWKHLKSKYHLRSGDRCRIVLEDPSKRLYRLDLSSK